MGSNEDRTKILSDNAFPVVGIGASAGGLAAFTAFLRAIPPDSGMAYVLVQHLAASHESILPELLQKETKLPVVEITDEIKVEPNHIYIIPSNKMLVANDGVLELSPRPEKTSPHLPIDLFFSSLAEVHQAHAIGIVLSGTASDGTAGLKAIKDAGGITFAQDEGSAQFEGMPQSAARAGVVDFVLSPEAMPAKLLEIAQILRVAEDPSGEVPREEGDVYKKILFLLRVRRGTDFTYYKQTTIRRRILRRMAIHKDIDPAAYLTYLQHSPDEQDALYQDFLIPVTGFFRDAQVFDALCTTVFPQLLEGKLPHEPIRIWVAACSTGEEAYSIAMCLKEYLGDRPDKVQIFATDISELAIDKARRASYSKSEVAGVSPERLAAFFTESGGRYRVRKSLRDLCVFASHNFLKDPPSGKIDFVSCRNVLIYLEPYLQKRALTTFHYALNPKGSLLLGKSETCSSVPDLFAVAGKSDKLFTRKDVPAKFLYASNGPDDQRLRDVKLIPQSLNMETDFQRAADDILLTQYIPASVVVNEAMDIVHFRGDFNIYLSQASGTPTHNLLKMARPGLAFELRSILHKAKKEGLPVVKESIPMEAGGIRSLIRIEAVPLPNMAEPHYLILFSEMSLPVLEHRTTPSAPGTRKNEAERHVLHLEAELAQARENMRSITEEQEAANEELQSANEELLSSSEEMQSLNEELETSKEELQSTNEELTILNQELRSLNEQVTAARNYAESVVATIHHPLLVLDRNLRVKSANDAFYNAFQVTRRGTEGVLVYDLGNRQWNIPALRTLLEEILPDKSAFTDFEVTHNFTDMGERVMLLSALEIKKEALEEHLILLTIQDITEQRKAVDVLRASEAAFRQIADTLPAKITGADAEGNVHYFNKAWLDYTGLRIEELQNGGWAKTMHPDSLAEVQNGWAEAVRKGNNFEMEIQVLNDKGEYRWHLSRATPVRGDGGKVIKWVGATTEIQTQQEQKQVLQQAVTERTAELQEATDSLLKKNEELVRMNHELESFTYVSSHDLQEPLRKIQTFCAMLREKETAALTEQGKTIFRRVESAASRMQTLIKDLLAYSHANRSVQERKKTNLNEIVTEVMSDLEDDILEKKATIDLHDLCVANINAFQFRQVVQNLFTNALKFSRPDVPPHIVIRCAVASGAQLRAGAPALPAAEALVADQIYCSIDFSDNGIGFEPEYSEKMFDVFQRLHTREQYAGTGIGLAIVKKIVEQHGGFISASSGAGQGARFRMFLPA